MDQFFILPPSFPAAANPERDENTKMRARVAARAALFSTFSDDLRRVVGSETSRNGLLMIFDMLQVGSIKHSLLQLSHVNLCSYSTILDRGSQPGLLLMQHVVCKTRFYLFGKVVHRPSVRNLELFWDFEYSVF